MIKYIAILLLLPVFNYAQVIISGNGELIASGDANIILDGDWTNNATNTGFTASAGTGIVYFHSANAQSIGGSQATTFGNIWLNNTNSASLTVNSTIYIVDKLDFELNGIMHVGTGSVTFKDDVVVENPTVDKFVDGPATYDGSKAFTFPIGDGAKWAPVRMDTPGSSVSVTAKYNYSAGATNFPPNSSNVSTPLVKVSDIEYWHITSTTSPSVKVRLFWKKGTESKIKSIDPDTLKFAKYDGANWVDEPAAITASTTSSGYISSNSALNLNDLYVTFGTTNENSNPLPISLTNFNVKESNNRVLINWTTASEINNDYFTLEKSGNAIDWEIIKNINGQGNSNYITDYSIIDENPSKGISYYRLSQTDFDGTFEYLGIKSIDYKSNSLSDAKIYPNPAKDVVNIEFDNVSLEKNIHLYNSIGQDIIGSVLITTNTINFISINISNLQSGLYILMVGTETRKIYKK
jgi:hypothetical protein